MRKCKCPCKREFEPTRHGQIYFEPVCGRKLWVKKSREKEHIAFKARQNRKAKKKIEEVKGTADLANLAAESAIRNVTIRKNKYRRIPPGQGLESVIRSRLQKGSIVVMVSLRPDQIVNLDILMTHQDWKANSRSKFLRLLLDAAIEESILYMGEETEVQGRLSPEYRLLRLHRNSQETLHALMHDWGYDARATIKRALVEALARHNMASDQVLGSGN